MACLTLRLATPHDALACERTLRLRDDRMLTFSVIIVVEIDHHPVLGPPQIMGPRCVGVERGEVPPSTTRMKHGEPGLSLGVEAPGCDGPQRPRRRLVPVLTARIISDERSLNKLVRLEQEHFWKDGSSCWNHFVAILLPTITPALLTYAEFDECLDYLEFLKRHCLQFRAQHYIAQAMYGYAERIVASAEMGRTIRRARRANEVGRAALLQFMSRAGIFAPPL
jgi:hypothetical protein